MASIAISRRDYTARFLTWLRAPIAREEWTRLLNWLLVWVVLANAAFALMWLVGGPARHPEIIATGAIGLIVRHRPRWLQFAAFCVAMIYSILSFIAGLFSLAIESLVYSLQFFAELSPDQSSDYVIAGGVIGLFTVLAWFGLRRPGGFTDLRIVLMAALAVWAYSKIDVWMNRGMRGHYSHMAEEGAPFTSAVGRSGFVPAAVGAKPRHLMIVMVESLGLPVGNPEMKRLLFSRYKQPDVTDRFELSSGSTLYYSSTTKGEIRELCGRWGEYYDLIEQRDDTCLPARLRRQGFETTAFHSFAGQFFHRDEWYPNIGFERQVFAEKLLAEGASECGGVFPGACDRDVPRTIADHLKRSTGPQFVYWLTLNSHIPVPLGANLEVDNCERISPELANEYPMICRQFAIWDSVDAALIEEITAPDFPPTDILVVGDHMPPYFDRHHRRQFAPDRVPWLLLRWKDDQPVRSQPPAIAGAPSGTVEG